ncbi:hypothetical protein COT20_00615 [bacterium (Candidatus Gribaldobacteria) CG08_land_8_20_14_0_20_39_15]|uniref:Uncharacterized protein n=1 Tax=bacterium (Candidatus Gribaldobacteria) CG08_land_8_20_14_0_20_39_15 TaxID=2014273 RepID=A0A2M6XV21_9BACT|nr:MAG: hypothetical protein COT20_00615 [bacterium (Candidatus Gribaldobacteria) CG08_land_8_20_14_0_20_39_15]
MYEFASAVIDVWEKRILSHNDQDRMLSAPDRASSFMVLFDTDLAETASATEDIEKIFENDFQLLKEKLTDILDDHGRLVNYLFLFFDVWNLKMALKRQLLKSKLFPGEPLVCSLTAYEKLKVRVSEIWQKGASFNNDSGLKNMALLNTCLEKIIYLTQQTLVKSPIIDSAQIETAVDKAYFEVKQGAAKRISPFLAELSCLEIDVANLKGLLSHNNEGFIEGGNLKIQEARKLLESCQGEISEENLEKFLEILNFSFLIKDFINTKSEIILEQGLQAFLSRRVFEKSRATACGLEKVLAFFYRKMNSHFNIRLILFAKDNNLPQTDIENLLLPI